MGYRWEPEVDKHSICRDCNEKFYAGFIITKGYCWDCIKWRIKNKKWGWIQKYIHNKSLSVWK